MNFTQAQLQSIEVTDRNLIVSAGAGAGKTRTLVERVFRLISAADNPADLDELLIVTFSRMAAQEMRERLATRLEEALEKAHFSGELRDHLQAQVYRLPQAHISTIHSFCLEMITSYPDRAGLAPGFEMMPEQEARLFRKEFLQRKIEDSLAQGGETAEVLRLLMQQLSPLDGSQQLLTLIIGLLNFLAALPEPQAFVERSISLNTAPKDGDPYGSSDFVQLMEQCLKPIFQRGLRALESIDHHPAKGINAKLHPQHATLSAARQVLEQWCLHGAPVSEIDAHLEKFTLPRLTMPRRGTETDADLLFRAFRDNANQCLKDLRKALEEFHPDIVRDCAFCSTRVLTVLLRNIGLGWGSDLFQEHVRRRRLTFAHLERLALQLLYGDDNEPSEIALLYRRQFRHVLVDEYQDVNELQERIVAAVARPAAENRGGNLFVVGDVKQSIYEFRMAEPSLFLGRYKRSQTLRPEDPPTKDARVNLVENFRSRPALLAELNTLFSHLMTEKTVGLDYRAEHQFNPGRVDDPKKRRRDAAFQIDILDKEAGEDSELDNVEIEAQYVADLVEEIGPPWRDITVLLRSTVGTVPALMDAFATRNIPAFSDSRVGFLTAIEVIEFQALLEAIYNPYNDVALLGALRGPAGNWGEEHLLDLRHTGRKAPLYQNLLEMAEDLGHPLTEMAEAFASNLARWQDQSTRLPMADFFALLLSELHLLEQAAVRPGGDQRRLNLLHLLDEAKLFDSFMRKGLGAFLDFLRDMIENEEDFAPPQPLPADAEVVRLMSIHQSKGMEFPIVVLPFLGKKFNEANLRMPAVLDRELGASTRLRDDGNRDGPASPLLEIIRQNRRKRERAEQLRLLYVALTRAEEAVYMTASAAGPRELLAKAVDGPNDPEELLLKATYLEWLLPYAGDVFGAGLDSETLAARGIVRVRLREAGEQWLARACEMAELRRESEALPDPSAELLEEIRTAAHRIDRLGSLPDRPRVRAKVSVSEMKRAYDAMREPQTPPLSVPEATLPSGRISWLRAGVLKPEEGLGPRRGTATHRFLACLDLVTLARPKGTTLARERGRMIEQVLLSEEDAQLVDLHAIAWMFNEPIGRRILENAARVQRERPFLAGVDVGRSSAEVSRTPMILQGVADLMFPGGDQWVLVDYKTDRCGPDKERLPHLVETYSPQLQLYCYLIEQALGRRVCEAYLAFLDCREIVEVPCEGDAGALLQRMVDSGAVLFQEADQMGPIRQGAG